MGAVYKIEIEAGVEVAMLFTPRLYEFKGREGVTFEHTAGDAASVQSLYADVMYCAALNHWTLTHSGEQEFPYHRIDFHEYSVTQPKAFGKALVFACECLSGKSVRELMENAGKREESGKDAEAENKAEEVVKKKRSRGWIMRLLRLFS